MSRLETRFASWATAMLVAGCASLAPSLPEPSPAIPADWPSSASATASASIPAADIGWRDFFADPALDELIARALQNNRDLRVMVLNLERARGLYRVQRADRYPTFGVGAATSHTGGGDSEVFDNYSVSLGLADFELDVFGRVRDLSRAALQRYFAEEENRRTAHLSLVAEVANVYLALAADGALLEVAQATLANQSDAFRLTQRRHELGAVSGLDLNQARTTVETARADVARYAGQVARDRNALYLLVGATVEPELLPKRLDPTVSTITELPAGVPSEVLLRRPDVLAAEHRLRAANANIGAARAAFFPSIRLTAAVGTASDALFGLFSGGSQFWSFGPRVNLPIFDMGRLEGNLAVARADQDIALAQYERTVQVGFREVADALALSQTLAAQRQAQEALLEASTRAYELSLARYKSGLDSFLVQLDAQRTQYAAQQALITTRLSEEGNRITLYRVLGGGWRERNP